MRVKGRGHRARELLDRPDAKHGQSLLMVQPRLSGPLDLAFHRVAWSCVVSYLTSTVAITMFPAVAPRCCSAREQKANQLVYTTAASAAATGSAAPVLLSGCPIRDTERYTRS